MKFSDSIVEAGTRRRDYGKGKGNKKAELAAL